ncbi:alpha/beta hydrolase [Mesorhizobium sp. RP14(2022)]|uniref:Alpha/beta hydrolase n=1 Tax=Mesorhizobium liriopis TaxID=2953882 RepID=A0ABT1C479_9HYPH|nr:alpha/beta hydrolase [Mesorhizobium liriopis]MCO6048756.1 alpha/beta hydrolase [Mesorhizobium liriopis]
MTKKYKLATSHGDLAVRESSGTDMPVMMIHGNSSMSEVFRNQFEGAIGAKYRLIAADLPGHGESADAIDPDRSYNMPGYADAMTEVLNLLEVTQAAVFGWSLGGHIGLEMIGRYPGVLGIMITGTPPIAAHDLENGFRPSPHMGLAGKRDFTPEDVDAYAHSTCGEPYDAMLHDAVARTDGRAREMMIAKFAAGVGRDQAAIVADPSTPPIAILNGADEPFVNVAFVDTIPVGNLWEGHKLVIDKSGHAPFWDSPERFDPIFDRFLRSLRLK